MSGKYFALLCVLTGLLTACSITDEVDVEAVIQERFRERLTILEGKLREDCREDVMELASRRADSLLIVRAQRMRRIEGRPPRPHRPGEPEVKELSAPLPLRPLFPFEIRFNTLLRDSLYRDSLRIDSIGRGLFEESL